MSIVCAAQLGSCVTFSTHYSSSQRGDRAALNALPAALQRDEGNRRDAGAGAASAPGSGVIWSVDADTETM